VRIILNQGSSRSTKTYSICQLFIALQHKESALFTIARKYLPSLRASAYRDYLEILKEVDIYNPDNHNKSELSYRIGDSECEFISVDQHEKIKGRKRKYLFMNEANEFDYNDFVQLSLRTTGKIFMDFNPSHDNYHWIETKIKTRDDVEIIHSTYKDNPFLEKETINEIERLKDNDPNLWKIYGLGIMGLVENLIFTHWQLIDVLPEGDDYYGLDFGYNNATCLSYIVEKDKDIYGKEIIYETRLTNRDLIAKMEQLEISKDKEIIADAEDPGRIKEIQEAGFNCIASDKGKDSVKKSIDELKSRGFYITRDSPNAQKELRGYKWKEKDGRIIDEPVKFNDHFLDSIRGAVYTRSNRTGLSLDFI